MNIIISSVLSLIVGCFIGLFYGHVFLIQRRRVFSFDHTKIPSTGILMLRSGAVTFVRIIGLALIWYGILLTPTINFILVILSFCGTFWWMILNKKA